MDLSDAVTFLGLLEDYDLTPAEVGYCVLYLDAREQAFASETLAGELNLSETVAESVCEYYRMAGAIERIADGRYRANPEATTSVTERLSWLGSSENQRYRDRIDDDRSATITPLVNFPGSDSEFRGSVLTGTLVDLLAGTDDVATVTVPFFSGEGFELLIDALVSVTARGGRLKILTRDIMMGSETNRKYLRWLYDRLTADGDPGKCTVYELNRDRYPEATLHAKSIISDSERAYLGSANFTEQSLLHALEMGLLVEGTAVQDISAIIEEILESDLLVQVSSGDIIAGS